MGAITTTEGLAGVSRLVIQSAPEGAYLFVFEAPSSTVPERDYLQDSVGNAQAQAQEDFGALPDKWTPWEGASFV